MFVFLLGNNSGLRWPCFIFWDVVLGSSVFFKIRCNEQWPVYLLIRKNKKIQKFCARIEKLFPEVESNALTLNFPEYLKKYLARKMETSCFRTITNSKNLPPEKKSSKFLWIKEISPMNKKRKGECVALWNWDAHL